MAGQSIARVFLLLSFLLVLVRGHAIHHNHRDIHRVRRGMIAHEAERIENRALKLEYEEKLRLRDTVLKALSDSQSGIERRQTTYTAIDLDQENQELQAGLDDLNTAFESLFNILAKNLPVCLGSTGVQAISVSVMASTAQPVSTVYSTSDVTSNSAVTSSTELLGGTDTSTTSTPTTTTTGSTATTISSSTFDPMSSSNVAVYYGQSNITNEVRLDTICKDDSVDIVVLAFVTSFDYDSTGYPSLNLGGSGCYAASTAQTDAGATGLIDCTAIVAPQIQTCQSLGKPVLLSIGGAVATVSIPSADDAATYAEMLWNLFGGGTGESSIRPFGDVSIDGFDIDNESNDPTNWSLLISSLRTYLSTASKPMYLSAAPQCPRPDANIPLTSMQSSLDFIFVQFYNNPSCDLKAGTAFLDSVTAWSGDINTTTASAAGETFQDIGNGVTSPRLFLGAPSFYEAGPDAYTPAADLAGVFEEVRGLGLGNLGGGMLWNAEWAEENKDSSGNSFVSVFKTDLE